MWDKVEKQRIEKLKVEINNLSENIKQERKSLSDKAVFIHDRIKEFTVLSIIIAVAGIIVNGHYNIPLWLAFTPYGISLIILFAYFFKWKTYMNKWKNILKQNNLDMDIPLYEFSEEVI